MKDTLQCETSLDLLASTLWNYKSYQEQSSFKTRELSLGPRFNQFGLATPELIYGPLSCPRVCNNDLKKKKKKGPQLNISCFIYWAFTILQSYSHLKSWEKSKKTGHWGNRGNTRACYLANLYNIRKGAKTPSEEKKLFLERFAPKGQSNCTPNTHLSWKGTSKTRF